MNITLLSVDIKTVPTAKGSYQTADVAYKNNTYGGKVEGKKIMSFGVQKDTFSTLAIAAAGDSFDVEVVKNAQGYNDWVKVVKSTPDSSPVKGTASSDGGAKSAPRSTFETPEERAQRQVLIVRQSSINSAIAALTPGAKAALKFDDIKALAKDIEDYVFDRKSPGASGFEDLPDFDVIPKPE